MNNVNTGQSILQVPWIVDISGEIIETEMHDGVKLPRRDRDGKYAPQAKPITRKQAMKKLSKQSRRLDAAIDRMIELENW